MTAYNFGRAFGGQKLESDHLAKLQRHQPALALQYVAPGWKICMMRLIEEMAYPLLLQVALECADDLQLPLFSDQLVKRLGKESP